MSLRILDLHIHLNFWKGNNQEPSPTEANATYLSRDYRIILSKMVVLVCSREGFLPTLQSPQTNFQGPLSDMSKWRNTILTLRKIRWHPSSTKWRIWLAWLAMNQRNICGNEKWGDGTETVWTLWLEFLILRDLLMVLDLYSGNITWIFF